MGIKGKTTFELTDVNTGEVEVIEDNNMVTNALQDFMLTYGIFNKTIFDDSNRTSELYLNLLSGLFLFDTALDENVDNTFMPAGVKMIGNGSRGVSNSGAVTELGSYNSAESGVQNDGSIKFVYDFSTSQANGTISCACLTSLTGGYMGMGSENRYVTNKRIDDHQERGLSRNYVYFSLPGAGDKYFNILYPVYNENAIYCTNPWNIDYSSATASQHWSVTKKIEIVKLRAGFTSVSIRDSQNLNKVIDRFEVDIPQAILDYMGTARSTVIPVGDSFNGNIFLIFILTDSFTSYIDIGSYYWIMKIDKDRNVTAHKLTNNTNDKLVISSTQSRRKCYTVNGDYFWMIGYNSKNVYGINYSDTTQIIETGINAGDFYPVIYSIAENLVGIGGGYYNSTYNYLAHSIYDVVNRTGRLVSGYEVNNDYIYIPFADKKGVYLKVYTTGGKMDIVKDVRYLATINNLAEPVIKTNSKTMKVTYTITEV
jgi:hypothetical protein